MNTKVGFWIIVPLALFCFAPLPIAPTQAQSVVFTETFDDPDLPGWERSPNARSVDGQLVIEGSGYALHGGSWAEAAITVRLRREGPGSVALHYHASDAGSYVVQFSDKGVHLLLNQEGQTIEFALNPVRGLEGEWNQLAVVLTGDTHTILLNNELVLEEIPPGLLPPGGLLLVAEGEVIVYFDDLIVEAGKNQAPTEEPTPTQEPEEHLQLSELTWVRLGGPPGGLGYDIRYNFDDPNTWYVTDDGGGVHISRDNGLNWQQSNAGISAVSGPAGDGIPVFSLTVDQHDPQTIWIGTTSGQIYKSIDGGLTWVEKDQGIVRDADVLIKFRGFTVDPRTSDIVYAMAELILQREGIVGSNTGGVVYRTADGGENWTRIWDEGIPSSLARYLWIDPRDPDVLYVSTGIFDASAIGEGDPETDPDPFGGLGVLKSTDGGATWRTLGKANGLNFLYIGSLYMHPDEPDVLLASAGRLVPELAAQSMKQQGHTPLGIYRTQDGGETWVQVLEPEGETLIQVFTTVEMCPSDPNIAYAGSDFAVYRSQDAGLTWTLMSGGPEGWGPIGIRAGIPIDFQCDPRDTDRLFANNYQGGNFLSEDGGRTWLNVSTGYSGAQMVGVAVDPHDAARVYASGRSGGWHSLDGGAIWDGIHNPEESGSLGGTECGSIAVDPSQEGHVLLACLSGFFERDAQANRWERRATPPDFHPGTSEIEFAPSDPRVVYVTSASHNTMVHADAYEDGRGILASQDGGTTWVAITGEQFRDAILTDISVDPQDARALYVAAQTGLFKTTDGGANWTAVSSLMPGQPVRTVAVSPADSRRVLAGVQDRGLFLSEDGGGSWRQVTAGLEPNGIHRDIVFDLTDPQVVYLADILSGVYRSSDGGETWARLTQGLTNRAVTTLSLSADGMHLYAGTSGGGVFRLDLNGQPPVPGSQPTPEPSQSQPTPELSQTQPAPEPSPPQSAPETPAETEKPSATPGPGDFPCGGALVMPVMIAGLAWFAQRKKQGV